MRLYLSSFRTGNKPGELMKLLGNGRRTALILNAMDFVDAEDRAADLGREIERLKSIGLEPVEIDLRSYFGKPEGLKEKLAEFDLIWVRGGNTFILRRAFKQSGADAAITALLNENKVVYGGYSAATVVLAPSLRGIDLVDDPNDVPDKYDAAIVWDGLGLVQYAIAPHYKSEHPESAAIDKSIEYFVDNHIPFIALRDGEAIVVEGSSQYVAG